MDDSSDELYEALTLDRIVVSSVLYPSLTPGRVPIQHHWGGYPVPARWNPKNLVDIKYQNREGKLHRLFGPAYISKLYDYEEWWKDGERHRSGGWAYRHKGDFAWFNNGLLHNLEGPAVVAMSAPVQYWIDGVKYSKKQYNWEIKRRCKNQKNHTP